MSLLEDYIKELNQLETAKRDNKFTRILSIDYVKGLAMCLIMLAHLGEAWITNEWFWAYGLLYAWLDVFGPSLFIFLSALSVVFSMKKKEGIIPMKVIRKGIYIRAFVVIFIAIIFNISFSRSAPFPYNIWGWNILMFIGFAQVISYYTVKLPKYLRVILGFLVIIFSYSIREVLFILKDENIFGAILHYIIVSPVPSLTILPYLAFCLFSTIFGEIFFETMLIETIEAYMQAFKSFMLFGLLSISAGIIIGGQWETLDTVNAEEYPFIHLLPIMQNQPYWDIQGMPGFLIQGTAANQLYALGCALLILGVAFYLIDIRHLNKTNLHLGHWKLPLAPGVNVFIFIGRVSLSLFFIHFLGTTLYYRQLDVYFFFPVIIAFEGYLIFVLYLWNRYADGKYSFEWLITNMGGKKKMKKRNKLSSLT